MIAASEERASEEGLWTWGMRLRGRVRSLVFHICEAMPGTNMLRAARRTRAAVELDGGSYPSLATLLLLLPHAYASAMLLLPVVRY